MSSLVEVAVPLPIFSSLTYRIPQELGGYLMPCARVLVPVGRRIVTGYVLGSAATQPTAEIKNIIDVLDREPLFSEDDLRFYRWVADYYHYPLGLTLKAALPPGLTIQYEDRAELSTYGEQALSDPSLDARSKHLLEILKTCGKLSVKTLRKKAGLQGFTYHLTKLSRAGLVHISSAPQRGKVRVCMQRWFTATDVAPPQNLRGRQQKLMSYIKDHSPVSEKTLRKEFGTVTQVLAALEQKGLITVSYREMLRVPPSYEPLCIEPQHSLTADQQTALNNIDPALDQRIFYPVLLYGITGSGKTEIYLHAMQRVLARGAQCLYLVPEIALTAQLYDRISSRLNVPIALLHSGMTDGERFDAWRMIRRAEVGVVIGARSALFAPFAKLGAIIVDEEHDSSYKQEDGLRYNARDMAVVRAKIKSCVVILGSATPSLESYANALAKKYHLVSLPRRVENRALPQVSIVPLQAQPEKRKTASILTEPLRRALAERLASGKQSLLFLNRRGFAPVYVCQTCGAALRCPNCAVSLIYHRGDKQLTCHYCGYGMALPQECPACGSYFLVWLGWGTERLEAELGMLFPGARIARMDRDTMAQRGAVHRLIKNMSRGTLDIVIGTQMLVKGYHLPEVTLVGVVCADQSLHFPDYRSSERTFQLLTQVAGRAGRGDTPGEVIIQTYTPDHYSIRCAQRHDYQTFYEVEMKNRRELGYPPYTKMVLLRFEGVQQARVHECATAVGALARKSAQAHPGIEILGPCVAPLARIRSRWRYHLLLKSSSSQKVRAFAHHLIEQASRCVRQTGVALIIDVDPLQMV